MGKILDILAANLEKAGTPYAKLVRLVEQRGRLLKAA
jgi:nitrate reductase assembly molybdenum cofactor insertion protein NarJ